jgi:hypothetical protein
MQPTSSPPSQSPMHSATPATPLPLRSQSEGRGEGALVSPPAESPNLRSASEVRLREDGGWGRRMRWTRALGWHVGCDVFQCPEAGVMLWAADVSAVRVERVTCAGHAPAGLHLYEPSR